MSIRSTPILQPAARSAIGIFSSSRLGPSTLSVSACAAPVTTGGDHARNMGIAYPIMGHQTTGVAICNQVRSFAIAARVQAGTVRYRETLDEETTRQIVGT